MMAPSVRRSRKGKKPARAGARKPAPRSRLEVDERRAQLLALGLSLFSQRSYDAVSIDELARSAGVSKGLLYHYFPTKRHLYVAALRSAANQLLDETLTDSSTPPEERARRGLDAYVGFVERHESPYVALMRGGIGSDPEVTDILDETRNTFVERILENVPPELAHPLVRTALRGWIGFVEATSIDWVSRRPVSRERLVTLLTTLLLEVVRQAAAVAHEPPDLPGGGGPPGALRRA